VVVVVVVDVVVDGGFDASTGHDKLPLFCQPWKRLG
jgi:hypothetical protein